MEAGLLWKEDVQALHDREYKDVELSHMLADNCAMQLLRNPKQFDVIGDFRKLPFCKFRPTSLKLSINQLFIIS